MPKFVVTKCVDAFACYVGIVDAATAADARLIAEEQDSLIDWKNDGCAEHGDDVDYDNVAPEPVADDFAFGVSDAEIITDMLAALKRCVDQLSQKRPRKKGTRHRALDFDLELAIAEAGRAIYKAEGRCTA